MTEILYYQSAILIAGGLLVAATVGVEIGYRIGLAVRARGREASAGRLDSVVSSMLGVLALVLGFTFSLALQRFDSRSNVVVNEANAIGTAYLRAYLLPVSVRSNTQQLLQDYVELRVDTTAMPLDDVIARNALLAKGAAMQDVLWRYARQAAEENPNQVTSGLFIESLNELIDSNGRSTAEFDRHVPEVVSYVLYGVFLIVLGIVGYAAGVEGHRPFSTSYIMVTVVILVMFIIIDLDRPRRGMIQISHQSLTDLHSAIVAGTYGNGIVPPH
jgi:hypothetical protein